MESFATTLEEEEEVSEDEDDDEDLLAAGVEYQGGSDGSSLQQRFVSLREREKEMKEREEEREEEERRRYEENLVRQREAASGNMEAAGIMEEEEEQKRQHQQKGENKEETTYNFGPEDWEKTLSLSSGSLLKRIQQLSDMFCGGDEIVEDVEMEQEEQQKEQQEEEQTQKKTTASEAWSGMQHDLMDSISDDGDPLQSASVLCLCHLGAIISNKILRRVREKRRKRKDRRGQMGEEEKETRRKHGMVDDEDDDEDGEGEEDPDYELLQNILQSSFKLTSADVSLRTRNRVISSVVGIKHMAKSAPKLIVPPFIEHLTRETEHLTEGELMALQSVLEPLANQQQLLRSVVPSNKALVLVRRFIEIVDGTAEFSSLAAQRAALNVIAEVGLLAGASSVLCILFFLFLC